MAGYCGFSKSNNAVRAENDGLVVASKLAKLLGGGVTAAIVKAAVHANEWHHTSKFFNCVNYYQTEPLVPLFRATGLRDMVAAAHACGERCDVQEAIGNVRRLRKMLAAQKRTYRESPQVWQNCTVHWLEWSGTRNHPKAHERSATGVRITFSGGVFVVIDLGAGGTFKKKAYSRGFEVFDATGKRVWFR
jgi:hypothetical protein